MYYTRIVISNDLGIVKILFITVIFKISSQKKSQWNHVIWPGQILLPLWPEEDSILFPQSQSTN